MSHHASSARPAAPLAPMRPAPAESLRPWAGGRLGAGVGEVWLAGPASLVDTADGTQRTLDELAAIHGERLVGSRGMAQLGSRFPLLVKVIDAAAWLSLQVHPTDDVAVALYGPGTLGKTEAWLVLDAEPDAMLITGPDPGLDLTALRAAIGSGTMGRAECAVQPGLAGDSYLIRAGTIHAIGAGLLVYEIEQPSDLTFRISDWGRVATAARPVHTVEALKAVDPGAHAVPLGRAWRLDGGALEVREFRLELLTGDGSEVREPSGRSVEIVTAVSGHVELTGDGWREVLEPFQTLVVPAAVPLYGIVLDDGAVACVGSLP